jgi:ectoine hydroxylase-related dioxygenase (phytanoyl-CoA dioxygenase family)
MEYAFTPSRSGQRSETIKRCHGAGANTANDWRYGVILTYSVGWVRQEENQYLNVTPGRLTELSPELKQIAGFDMYHALGFHDPSVS